MDFVPANPLENSHDSIVKALVMSATLRHAYTEVGGELALANLSRYLGNTSSQEAGGGVNVAREVSRRTEILTRRADTRINVMDNGFIHGVLTRYASSVVDALEGAPRT